MRLQTTVVLAVVLSAAVAGGGTSATANTNTSCKGAAVTAFGMTQPAANSAWEKRVTSEFGGVWANLGIAVGYSVHRRSFMPSPNAVQVYATPCEVLPPTASVNAPHPRP